jgi:hypothetical protein
VLETAQDLQSVTVAIWKEGDKVPTFASFMGVATGEGGCIVDTGDGSTAFCVPSTSVIKATIAGPTVGELDLAGRTKPLGAVFLDRVAIEDAIRAGGADVRVSIVRAGGGSDCAVSVPALDLLNSGCYVAQGDPLWAGSDERAPAPLHSTSVGLIAKLATLSGQKRETAGVWKTTDGEDEEAVAVVARKRRKTDLQIVVVPISLSSLPAPLGLLRSLDDPIGCIGSEIPRSDLETGVRNKLRELLSVLQRERRQISPSAARPPPEAEHAAWQILHGVVLSTAEGAKLRDGVRYAERTIVRSAVGPCEDDATVEGLAKKTRALSLLTERHGGPFTAAQVAATCGIKEEALPNKKRSAGSKFYRVPFELALSAIGERDAVLHDGYAYVLASDIPDVLASLAEELSTAVERAGDAANLGDAFVLATTGKAPELPYHHDAIAMQLALEAATREGRMALGVDADEALRSAPACVHALLFACAKDGRLPHEARIEIMRCLLDCGFGAAEAAEMLESRMSDEARKNCTAIDLVALARSYARNEGHKSSRCSVLQKPWKPNTVCSMPAACPYPVLLDSLARKEETEKEAGDRKALSAQFFEWMGERSAGVPNIEDLSKVDGPFMACRCHVAKLVSPDRIKEANSLNMTSPATFLKFVLGTKK